MVNVNVPHHPCSSPRTPEPLFVLIGRPAILPTYRPAASPNLAIRATFGVSGAWTAENASLQLRPGSAELARFSVSDRTNSANSGSRRGVN